MIEDLLAQIHCTDNWKPLLDFPVVYGRFGEDWLPGNAWLFDLSKRRN